MKVISIKKEQVLMVLYLLVIAAGLIKSYTEETVETVSLPVSKKVIMIDPGHGGWDPGKVTESGVQEKDINLAIAAQLQMYLEQGGSTVLISRGDDTALANEKNADLNSRTVIADTGKADILVSIHQNSYPSSSVHGAQVFYYDTSDNSKTLAESIQKELIDFVDTENNREAKSDKNYYLLKRTKIPAVIVECGFLSNGSESAKLQQEEYQEKVAWGIYMGIVNYYNADGQV